MKPKLESFRQPQTASTTCKNEFSAEKLRKIVQRENALNLTFDLHKMNNVWRRKWRDREREKQMLTTLFFFGSWSWFIWIYFKNFVQHIAYIYDVTSICAQPNRCITDSIGSKPTTTMVRTHEFDCAVHCYIWIACNVPSYIHFLFLHSKFGLICDAAVEQTINSFDL